MADSYTRTPTATRNKQPEDKLAAVLLTLTMLCYAGNHVIGRAVHGDLPPLGLSFWRWSCGAIILFPFICHRLIANRDLYLLHWRLFALLGFLMIGSTTLILVGLNFTTAINTSLINASQPVITAFLCWLFLNDRLHPRQWVGVILALAGIIIMILQADINILLSLNFNGGDLVVLGAMFGFATYAINIRKIPAAFTASESLFVVILFGLIALLPFYLAETHLYKPMPASIETIQVVIVLALLVSVLGMLMWTRGNQLIGPNRAAVYMNLLPLFGTLLAVLFLKESIALYHILGGIMILGGMWLALHRETCNAYS